MAVAEAGMAAEAAVATVAVVVGGQEACPIATTRARMRCRSITQSRSAAAGEGATAAAGRAAAAGGVEDRMEAEVAASGATR